MSLPPRRSQAGSVLAACWFLKFCCGGLAPNGTINSFYIYIAEDWGVPVSSVTLMNTLMCVTTMLVSASMGRMMLRRPPRQVIIGSYYLGLSGYMLCAVARGRPMLYLGGILIGIGNACLTYSAVPFMINLWFEGEIAFFISIATSGQALGKLIFSPLCTYMTSQIGWRWTMAVFGTASGLLFLATAGRMLRNSPASMGLRPYTQDDGEADAPVPQGFFNLPADKAVKTRAFLLLEICAFFAGYCLSVNTSIVAIAKTSGALSSGAAGFSSAAIAGGMFMGEPVFGKLLSGGKHTLRPVALFSFIQISGMLLIAGVYTVPGLMIAGCFLIGLGVGATASVMLAYFCRILFGSEAYSQSFQRLVTIISAANASSSFLTNYIYDISGSYVYVLYAMAAMTLLILLFAALALREGRKAGAPHMQKADG